MVRNNGAKQQLTDLYKDFKKSRTPTNAGKVIFITKTTGISLKGIVDKNDLSFFEKRGGQMVRENRESNGDLFKKIKNSLKKEKDQAENREGNKKKQKTKNNWRFSPEKVSKNKNGKALLRQTTARNKGRGLRAT